MLARRREAPAAGDLIACTNGLLHLPTRKLHKPTPHLYGHHAVDFDLTRGARARPSGWTFLATCGATTGGHRRLQAIFGYALTADTRQQKVFLLVGPRRSGKGTIARVLKALLGTANVAGPTLSGLGTNFGLAPLIGKPLAIISDARLSGKADQHVIAERLLSISGRTHSQSTASSARLDRHPADPLPDPDQRAAAYRRCERSARLPLHRADLDRSFYGREDHGLTDRLLPELPGILNWSLEGWTGCASADTSSSRHHRPRRSRSLRTSARPSAPSSESAAPSRPERMVACQLLFDAWSAWGEAQGRKEHGSVQTFGRDLRAAVPGLKVAQPAKRDGARSEPAMRGFGLSEWHAVARDAFHCTRARVRIKSIAYNAVVRVPSRAILS